MPSTTAIHSVTLRDYPRPYCAMLAICSDLDETLDLDTYLEIARFLNTRHETAYGQGVGLEVGNTIYFDMAPGELSYWSVSEDGRDKLRALMKSGHIDCFHSFGDLARRPEAARALEELSKHGCRLKVWVDHAVAPTNLGLDIMRGRGDVEDSDSYHTDLTWQYGVRFVWTGRVTSMIGQNVKPNLASIWSAGHPLASAETLAKELAKRSLARAGHEKYRLHARNLLIRPYLLRDRQAVWEFMRCNPHWGGVSYGDTGEGLGEALRPRVLDALIERRGASVVYTHLGKGLDRKKPLGERTVTALRRLAALRDDGRVLVTTTARLLAYHKMRDALTWSASADGETGVRVDVVTSEEPAALPGLTFDVADASRCKLFVNGVLQDVVRYANGSDARESVAIPWDRAEYPL